MKEKEVQKVEPKKAKPKNGKPNLFVRMGRKLKEVFSEIKKVLSDAPSFADTCDMLTEVGMNYSDFPEFYGEAKIKDAYLYAKDLKDRYSVLWTYFDLFS